MKSAEVIDGGLFTENYCKICNAQLISESQRVAHYESKKHANKVRLYYMLHPEDGGPPSKKLRPDNPDSDESEVDRNKCCTLCNMFFTSAVVAESHYQGKTHAKRMRLVLGYSTPHKSTTLKSSYTCNVCNVILNSVEQYHAHLQGIKHQNKCLVIS
ncbi:zinc finger protein [Latimeria chalumnae]|uniref:zinc finger protein n=1 Tax=Latimeria chalumnae TaxID=7897 RepID=UPI00313AD41C